MMSDLKTVAWITYLPRGAVATTYEDTNPIAHQCVLRTDAEARIATADKRWANSESNLADCDAVLRGAEARIAELEAENAKLKENIGHLMGAYASQSESAP
jgi:chromosome segregation ATPase